MSITAKTTIALAALAASSIAAAQGYVGIGVGQSRTDFNSGYTAGLTEGQDRTDTGYKLFAGYDFNRTWAIELGYNDLGKANYSYAGAGIAGNANVKQTAWTLVGKGTMPIGDAFGLFGKLGASWNRAEINGVASAGAITALGGAFPQSSNKTRSDVLVGVGAEYAFRKQLMVRLEYEDFGKFGEDATGRTRPKMWSLGVGYKY